MNMLAVKLILVINLAVLASAQGNVGQGLVELPEIMDVGEGQGVQANQDPRNVPGIQLPLFMRKQNDNSLVQNPQLVQQGRSRLGQPQQQVKDFKPSMKTPQAELAVSPECREDVARLCEDRLRLTNLEILSCMSERVESEEDLSDECHTYLWNYKVNVTKDPKFTKVAAEVCRPAYSLHTDWGCDKYDEKKGMLIPCLLDHKNEINHRPCYHFLVKMGTIIFSDYRLVCDFVDDCKADIEKHQCARFPARSTEEEWKSGKKHSQGAVIRCLEDVVTDGEQVDEKCAKQIVRLAELSSDDFHLDTNLYHACKNDREQLCDEVAAGEGKVYRCLFQHKFDEEMSAECRDALTTRQRLVAQDYKASFVLQQSCKKDIENLNCMAHPEYKSMGGNDHSDVLGLSGMLLCMEAAKFSDNPIPISPQCDSSLVEFRRMLSEDYKMSPEIMYGCKMEITIHCNENGIAKNGGTIHCLMRLAQEDAKSKVGQIRLGDKCTKAMIHLLREDHAATDYKMNKALASACNPVVATACKQHADGDPLILSCLVENLYSNLMTEPCRKRLLELQFFLARDFQIDENFQQHCHKDAKKLCNDKLDQVDGEVTMPFSTVISCLYRHIPNVPKASKSGEHTSAGCADEVRRIMKSRALDYNLNPDLEKACIYYLGLYCSDTQVDKGYELLCLQEHIENITDRADAGDTKADECINMIEDLTSIEEAEAGNLDDILLQACDPDIAKFCSIQRDSDEDGQVMRCLVENKLQLNKICALRVEHLQIIELQDVKFSYNFMKACKKDIQMNCQILMDGHNGHHSPTRKNEIIECLSGKHIERMLMKKESPISEDCLVELTFENLQRHDDSMKLNPTLKKACQADYKKFCKTSSLKGMECLRQYHYKISPKCRKELFKIEKEEAVDPKLDVVLMRTCKGSIMKFCDPNANSETILECLILNKDKFENSCYKIVLEREREKFSDINLNPQLLQACTADIKTRCNEKLSQVKRTENQEGLNDGELHGEVIECLKEVETDPNAANTLSRSCSRHIRYVMREEATEYELDPMLTLNCIDSVQKFCPPESTSDVIDCLKINYFQGQLNKDTKCMVQVARSLRKGRSDIMADPVLHNACQLDIHHYCAEIPEGKGRIITCIMNIVDSKKASPQCTEAIKQRRQMWKFAREHNVDSFGKFADFVGKFEDVVLMSPESSNCMIILTSILIAIFLFGICCYCVTKCIYRQRQML